jgi:hypothetical protein
MTHQIRIHMRSLLLVSGWTRAFFWFVISHLELDASLATVRLELAKEEAALAKENTPHEMSPSAFIQIGLDLEEQQCVISCSLLLAANHFLQRRVLHSASKVDLTTHEEAERQEKQNTLHRRISSWQDVQRIYMPILWNDAMDIALMDTSVMPLPSAETIPLRLPSGIPLQMRSQCLAGITQIEARFRQAQAQDALAELRRLLRVKMGLHTFKHKQVGVSQKGGTRAQSLINRFKDKIERCANRYRAAYAALQSLDPKGNLQSGLHDLRDGDLKGPCRGEDEAEGTRELSWIWLVEWRGHCTRSKRETNAEVVDGK